MQSKKCFPSPLAGEGQGEGDPITDERSEHLSSTLKTQPSTLLLAADSLAESRG
jgi:hypothetical protein